MRKVLVWVVAGAVVATVGMAYALSARADPAEGGYVAEWSGADSDEPTTPAHDLPGVNDNLDKMAKDNPPVVASGEIDGPTITQSPVSIP